jgi:hypothetical protein
VPADLAVDRKTVQQGAPLGLGDRLGRLHFCRCRALFRFAALLAGLPFSGDNRLNSRYWVSSGVGAIFFVLLIMIFFPSRRYYTILLFRRKLF